MVGLEGIDEEGVGKASSSLVFPSPLDLLLQPLLLPSAPSQGRLGRVMEELDMAGRKASGL